MNCISLDDALRIGRGDWVKLRHDYKRYNGNSLSPGWHRVERVDYVYGIEAVETKSGYVFFRRSNTPTEVNFQINMKGKGIDIRYEYFDAMAKG